PMYELLSAIAMGVLQGATEFLPISSSGHLRLAETLFALPKTDLLFDIILHVGTLVAVCAVYREALQQIIADLWSAAAALLRTRSLAQALRWEGARLALLIVVATVPTGILGIVLDKLVDGPWLSLGHVGGLLIINGLILLLSGWATPEPTTGQDDRSGPDLDTASMASSVRPGATSSSTDPDPNLSLWRINLPKALLIGVAQGLAVLPGISRSGLTITVCLMLGVEREQAARFSFLLSIPAILGALVLKFDPEVIINAPPAQWLRFGLGALSAALVGYICLVLLIKLLKEARFHHFAWYCFAVGALAIGRTLM
ncbi:MAG: undecaprenyl-diphosphate phosphatase, partial [Myxococcota bacterium]